MFGFQETNAAFERTHRNSNVDLLPWLEGNYRGAEANGMDRTRTGLAQISFLSQHVTVSTTAESERLRYDPIVGREVGVAQIR
jgi:hypothetical protein